MAPDYDFIVYSQLCLIDLVMHSISSSTVETQKKNTSILAAKFSENCDLGGISNWYFEVALWLAGAIGLDISMISPSSRHQYENRRAKNLILNSLFKIGLRVYASLDRTIG